MMVYIWLGLFVATIAIEIIVPGLVSIWFAAGSLVSLILSAFLGDSLIWLQVLAFVLVSGGFLFLLRPVLYRKKEEYKSNVDAIVGKIGTVEEDIHKYSLGTVKIGGLVWNAEIDNSKEELQKGELVIVKEINGNKIKVEKYEEVSE